MTAPTRTRGGVKAAGPARHGTLMHTGGVIGAVLALWLATAFLLRDTSLVPYPWELAAQFAADGSLLAANIGPTLSTAVWGFGLGVVVIIPLVVISILAPTWEPVVVRVAVVVHVIPFVAIAPILVVVFQGQTARVVVAALAVYFPLLINLLLGLRSTDDRARDVVFAAGGGPLTTLRMVRVPSALPSLVAGLQIAVPAAVLGALIAEFFGANEGLGAILISAQDALMINRVWAIAITMGLVSAAGYALVTIAARILVPWAGKGGSVGTSVAGAEQVRLHPWQLLVGALASVVVLVGGWWSLRPVFGLDEFFVKDPLDVWRFLQEGNPFTGAPAEEFWTAFTTALGESAVHAAVGFVVGTLVAVSAAVLLVAVPSLERAVMPFAIVLRSMPLVAITPLIVLVFGRDLVGVTVLVTLVTFFPTLVTVMAGLKAAPDGALDVIYASGGSARTAAFRARIPYALPAITASARIAVPGAVTGATLAEWIATGNGLGNLLTSAAVRADYFTLWSGGLLLVLIVLVLYSAINLIDRLVARRLGVAF
ncbi:ABC transporter permease [Ruania alba]|uniref:ABC-type nitrate/sulfonate/bicarbonate transport system, permease component n=1 Tax=Ruania alba TaxID=648782 RepID=A0A1H5MSL4_9MICO|nr:ABC transporter permease subunit [Ruania alba]SEE91358.1 ABC-type nitrate/sulfonate/bicarbonate transport system, permease component [Ruania alba]